MAMYPGQVLQYAGCLADKDHWTFLQHVLTSAKDTTDACASVRGGQLTPNNYIPQLLGLLPVCGTDPEVYYAWKLFLIKPWRVIDNLKEGFCSYEEASESLLDSSTYLLAL